MMTNRVYLKELLLIKLNAMLDLAELAGIDGVVCSPHELKLVKKDNLYYQ